MKVEILFLGFLAALGLVSIFTASFLSLRGGRFPLLVSFVFIVLVSLQGLVTVRRKTSEDPRLSRESLREFLSNHGPIIFWCAASFFFVYLFGFTVGTFLLVLGYMLQKKEKWLVALAYAVGMGLFTYFGFQVALQVRFYPGLIAELLGF